MTAQPWFDRQAVVDTIPLVIPAVPFGFVVGLAITESEMPLWAAWLSSPLIFAGAAQLAMVTIAGTASLWAVITAVLVINSRHVMYSAAFAPTFRAQPRWFRWFGPTLLIDQVFAITTMQTSRDPASFRRYYITAGLVFLAFWNVAVPLGMLIGPIVPTAWRLDYAPPIMFAGLTLFAINRLPAGVAAIVGGLVSLFAAGLRDRLGILIGAVSGVLAGAIVEQLMSSPPTNQSPEAS
jgi:predicted branched-subunit amino acid permease